MDDVDHLNGNKRVRALSLSLGVAKKDLHRTGVLAVVPDREVREPGLDGRVFGKKKARIRHS
jgi:hypothetical protein